ncbi:hypothetical protein [Agrobacterium larrymoorei]|uniref:hypothetical protein n=1 Tax=Agrobacterium larrymoorei TaxID=160699 RepID=UPI0030BF9D31
MADRTETLKHLATKGLVWDGDLISKTDRDELMRTDHVQRCNGWNFLTMKGAAACIELGLVAP